MGVAVDARVVGERDGPPFLRGPLDHRPVIVAGGLTLERLDLQQSAHLHHAEQPTPFAAQQMLGGVPHLREHVGR